MRGLWAGESLVELTVLLHRLVRLARRWEWVQTFGGNAGNQAARKLVVRCDEREGYDGDLPPAFGRYLNQTFATTLPPLHEPIRSHH